MVDIKKLSNTEFFLKHDNNTPFDVSILPSDASIYAYLNGKQTSDSSILHKSEYYSLLQIIDPSVKSFIIDGNTTQIEGQDSSAFTQKRIKKMVDNDTSFELLRTNPKLTGNFKVVVDSDENLYLDTFKVSNGLSQQKYRKIKINPEEYYGDLLMSKMSSLPSTDIYKIEDSCYELFTTANNLGEQYYDKYNSGVRTNNDKLYKENFSLLAPICLRKTLPDFFLVFKIKHYENFKSNKEKIEYFFSNGTLVKSYDLRQNSNIGKFIRNMYNRSRNFVGDIYTSYDYNNYDIYNGISIDRGTPSKFFDSVSEQRNLSNQVAMNDWYTLGFERKRLVSKDILNLEFMFDDTEERLFSLNTYFGIYVRINGENNEFGCIDYDEDRGFQFSSHVAGTKGDSQSEEQSFDPQRYQNIIYGLSDDKRFIRLEKNIDRSDILYNYMRKPYKNIASTNIVEYPIDNTCFVSVQLNETLEPGEHYRIVDNINYQILEVIVTNYKDEMFDLSEITYDSSTFNTGNNYLVKRISIYNIDYRKEKSLKEDIKNQGYLIKEAFNSLDDKITAYFDENDTFSILYQCTFNQNTNFPIQPYGVYFEKVSSICGISNENEDIITNDYTDESSYIFGLNWLKGKVISSTSTVTNDLLLYPLGFESLGDRYITAVMMIPTKTSQREIYVVNDNLEETFNNYNSIIYATTERINGEYVYDNFFTTSSQNDVVIQIFNYGVVSGTRVDTIRGFGDNGGFAIRFNKTPYIKDDEVHFYQNYPINAGICSIFPVKDFDFDIIDNNSTISTKEYDIDKVISDTPGEYQESNNFMSVLISSASEESICDYFDKNREFSINDDIYINSGSMTEYLKKLKDNNHTKSDISLISPYCCKWKTVGTDHRGKSMRVMFPFVSYDNIGNEHNDNYIINGNSYFIPKDSSNYIGLIATDSSNSIYPKYLNDTLVECEHLKYRDFTLYEEGNIDDTLYNIENFDNRFSKAYSIGDDTLEFISGGIKIRISTNKTSIVDISSYNNYSAILILMEGNNPTYPKPCELLIDETEEQIALIIYSGNDNESLLYTDKNVLREGYKIPFNKQLSDCKVVYSSDGKSLLIPDCGGFYNDSSIVGDNGNIFITSKINNKNCYDKEDYIYIDASISGDNIFDDNEPNYLHTDSSVRIMINGVSEPLSSFTLNHLCEKYKDNVTAYINSLQIDDDNLVKTASSPITLSTIKNIINDISIFIKTDHETKDFTTMDNLLNVEIIDPYEIERENSEYVTTMNGLVHQTYAEPVTKNIFDFIYENEDVDNISNIFSTDFVGANIIVDDVENIKQVWMRKYLQPNGKISVYEDDTTITQTYDYITINVKDDEYKLLPQVGTYSQIYNDPLISLYQLNSLEGLITYKSINDVRLSGDSSLGYFDEGEEVYLYNMENGAKKDAYINSKTNVTDYYSYQIFTDSNYVIPDDFYVSKKDGSVKLKVIIASFDGYRYYKGGTLNIYPEDMSNITLEKFDSSIGSFNSINGETIEYTTFFIPNYEEIVYGKKLITPSLTLRHDVNPLINCYNDYMFRTFSEFDEYTQENGSTSGYEKNKFFASRGLNLKSKENNEQIDYIEISNWKNVVEIKIPTVSLTKNINLLSDKNNAVKIDITESIINKIMASPGYTTNWSNAKTLKDKPIRLTISSRTQNDKNMKNYIEKTILPNITIDETCEFSVYVNNSTKKFKFVSETDFTKYEKLTNTKNSLVKENGKYYMIIQNLGKHTYAAKLKINL